MPHKKKQQSRSRDQQFSAERFLRSINLCYDATVAERISHFRPTSKMVSLVQGLLAQEEDRAFFVIAPYGSGKSITLTYLLHLIENRPESRQTLRTIGKRLKTVSPELHGFTEQRLRRKKRGLAVALHGYLQDLPAAIKNAVLQAMSRQKLGRQAKAVERMPSANIEDATALLVALKEKCDVSKLDRVTILWDEAGRHIEALVEQGRAAELADIQLMAELVSRSTDLPMTFGLSLHQGLLHYVGQMSQSVRAEWMKISGRFREIQYIDDSKEVYRLISEVAEANRTASGCLTKKRSMQLSRKCRDELGLFDGFSLSELAETLRRAYPLEPLAFYLLPRISARVAQYERTLFTFLYTANMGRPVSVADLYDYFSPAMRADTAVGGTYRQWLETQSAISKVDEDPRQVLALKTACLLGLGTSGERSRASRDAVMTALAGLDERDSWSEVVDALIERNLLLHRRHSDELSVWHGTDVDLRGRLEDEKNRQAGSFDLCRFLEREAVPRPWKPLRHNSDYGVRRYWEGEYITAESLSALASGEEQVSMPIGRDGKVLYCLAEDSDQLQLAGQLAREVLTSPRTLVVVPASPLRVREAALEVFCLSQMTHSSDLVGSDPLVLPQLQQMMDDARSHLQRILDRLLRPSAEGPHWFHRGQNLGVVSVSALRMALSDISDQVFDRTPKIHNELIVRRKPSGTIVNSRKKLLLGILDRHGQEELGIRGHFPDYSMFRTVLLHTGLYREEDGRWGYSAPRSKALEPGIKAVWKKLWKFFGTSRNDPKDPATLFDQLKEPPYGVREGLLPILFAAGFKAFAQVVSLTREGRYVTDVKPDDIEDLCRNPDAYRLEVLDLDDSQLRYLRRLQNCFSPIMDNVVGAENELIRLCYDAVQGWKFQLPSSALTTRSLSRRTSAFQKLLREEIDPVKLLLHELPAIAGTTPNKTEKLIGQIQRMKQELEGVAKTFVDQASASIRKAITHGVADDGHTIRDLASAWAVSIPDVAISSSVPAVAKGLLARMQTGYDSDDLLVESLSLLLVGRPVGRWDDSTAVMFNSRLHDMMHRIEEAALESQVDGQDAQAWEGMSDLIRQRLDQLLRQLVSIVGRRRAEKIVKDALKQDLAEARHDDAD